MDPMAHPPWPDASSEEVEATPSPMPPRDLLAAPHASGPATVAAAIATRLSRNPHLGAHVTAIVLLDQGHTFLAVAVGLPLYVPFLLWSTRRTLAQGRALAAEVREGFTRVRRDRDGDIRFGMPEGNDPADRECACCHPARRRS